MLSHKLKATVMVACDFDSMCLYFQSSKLDGVIWQVFAGIVEAVPLWNESGVDLKWMTLRVCGIHPP